MIMVIEMNGNEFEAEIVATILNIPEVYRSYT